MGDKKLKDEDISSERRVGRRGALGILGVGLAGSAVVMLMGKATMYCHSMSNAVVVVISSQLGHATLIHTSPSAAFVPTSCTS